MQEASAQQNGWESISCVEDKMLTLVSDIKLKSPLKIWEHRHWRWKTADEHQNKIQSYVLCRSVQWIFACCIPWFGTELSLEAIDAKGGNNWSRCKFKNEGIAIIANYHSQSWVGIILLVTSIKQYRLRLALACITAYQNQIPEVSYPFVGLRVTVEINTVFYDGFWRRFIPYLPPTTQQQHTQNDLINQRDNNHTVDDYNCHTIANNVK